MSFFVPASRDRTRSTSSTTAPCSASATNFGCGIWRPATRTGGFPREAAREWRSQRLGAGGDFRVCYATSKDGVNWERPALGLVDYGGNKQNNLIDFPIGKFRVINLIVIEDPEDPDPARRFKMAFQSPKYQSRVAVANSPDGLRWKEFEGNPVSKHMSEIHGLIRHNGVYYVNGHGGSPRTGPNEIMPRRMITFMSYDFEHWAEATALSFERHGGEIPQPWRGHSGEQVHTGASLWDRGNVIIGFYGQWHGHPSDDRRMVTMDLGMIVGNDGLPSRSRCPTTRSSPATRKARSSRTPTSPARGSGRRLAVRSRVDQGQGWETWATRRSTGTACGRREGSASPPGCATGSVTSRCRWRSGRAGKSQLLAAG